MRVFNVNKAIGRASSGVEYAQMYRSRLLAGIPWVDDRYVFTDYMATHPSVAAARLGFARERVIWIYDLLTGGSAPGCTVSVDELLAAVDQPHGEPQRARGRIDLALTGTGVRLRIWTVQGRFVDRVETIVRGEAVRVAHYADTLHSVEHFHDGKAVRRVFHTPDGRVAAEQFLQDGEIVRTRITPASPLYAVPVRRGRALAFPGDLLLDGRSAFLQHVFARLFDRPDDVVIVDRALDVIDGIYPVIGDRSLYSVVHAEHYDLRQIDDGVLLWNNHYEHVFTRPDLVDGFIVSTRRQQQVLQDQLSSRFPDRRFPVACIPVGVVHEPTARAGYEPQAVVTVSRLAAEKHIDILIRAVAIASKILPGIRLDVYGEGQRDPLDAVIEETGMRDRVRLMGHRELAGVLGGYAVYASASTSEGFGLSLLEAMAEGLPLVGFDVEYGNREMVEPGVNGRLVPCTFSERDAEAMAEALIETLTSDRLDDMRAHSLRKAAAYTADGVRRLWEDLLSEGPTC
ncbi:glycosyltransferase [Microbacterium tumbae]